MTYLDLQRRLNDKPFKPFRIRMVNSTVYDVLEPWMIIIGDTSCIIVTHVRKENYGYETALDWRTVAIAHMLEFADIEPPKRQKKPA